ALSDPRVFWAGQLDNEGRPMLPVTANTYSHNVALVDLHEDDDRVLRRFVAPLAPLPHMALKVAEKQNGPTASKLSSAFSAGRLINFRGVRESLLSISALAVLRGSIPPGFFKNKIVLIGSHSLAL